MKMDELEFASIILQNKINSTKKRLLFRLNTLFEKLEFNDKTVLDVGGGEGLLSFYASFKGAREVICLEPAKEGSRIGAVEKFHCLKTQFQSFNVSLCNDNFQNFNSDLLFDIIIMHNSINHINEQACMNLRSDKKAKSEYSEYFKKLFKLTNLEGHMIISDCSHLNFWHLIKIQNPYVKSIEWDKHQSPEVWIDMCQRSGFRLEKIKWSSFSRFGKTGEKVIGNRFAAYFFDSHFNLYFIKD